MRELEPTSEQEAQTETSLQKLARKQMQLLAGRIRDELDDYADPVTTKIVKARMLYLDKAALSFHAGAHLDAIDQACFALDLGE